MRYSCSDHALRGSRKGMKAVKTWNKHSKQARSPKNRKPLNIPLKNVYECLKKYRSVAAAADELGCSQGYIFNVLKANGLKLKDLFKE